MKRSKIKGSYLRGQAAKAAAGITTGKRSHQVIQSVNLQEDESDRESLITVLAEEIAKIQDGRIALFDVVENSRSLVVFIEASAKLGLKDQSGVDQKVHESVSNSCSEAVIGGNSAIQHRTVSSVGIKECVAVTKHILNLPNVDEIVRGDRTLEVSTPGVSRKLRSQRSFLFALGEEIEVKLNCDLAQISDLTRLKQQQVSTNRDNWQERVNPAVTSSVKSGKRTLIAGRLLSAREDGIFLHLSDHSLSDQFFSDSLLPEGASPGGELKGSNIFIRYSEIKQAKHEVKELFTDL